MPLNSVLYIISKPKFRQLPIAAVSLNTNNVMAQSISDKVGAQKRIEDSQSKEHEGIDQDKKLGTLSRDIIPHILNLYGCTAKAHDFEIYAPNATFEDPFMSAKGVKQIKSAFYSLSKVEHGKIIQHEDRWGKGPLKNRHTVSVPLVGHVAEGFRKCTGLITHAMMGFGKDPTP